MQKKLISLFQENVWADGRRGRQIVFDRILPADTRITTTSLQQVTAENMQNLVLKRMLRYFVKILPLKKIYKILKFVLRLETGARNVPQNILQTTWNTEYEKSNNIWIIYWYNKSKILAILWTFLNVKKNMNLYAKCSSTLIVQSLLLPLWLTIKRKERKWTTVSNAYISYTQTSLKQLK